MRKATIPDARVDYLYYTKGYSLQQVAESLGYTPDGIYKSMKRRGKKLRPRGRHKLVTINLSGDWRKQLNASLRK
tara:strand:- start:4 stop:228 length:225 start_codon:yes stop_codon:yes gene_type:complete